MTFCQCINTFSVKILKSATEYIMFCIIADEKVSEAYTGLTSASWKIRTMSPNLFSWDCGEIAE